MAAVGPLGAQWRPLGAPWVHQGVGHIKAHDKFGRGLPLIWLLWGALWAQWRPLGAPLVHEGRGLINLFDN